MRQYHRLLDHLLTEGRVKKDRTGTGTLSTFGYQMRFNLAAGFPLVTTKAVHWHSVVHELLWFLAGDTNVGYLQDHGVRIWNEWADANGNLGPVYGKQWRRWQRPAGGDIDQIAEVVQQLRDNPDSRRMLVAAWNPADVPRMALPPCHCLFQFYSEEMTQDERKAWADAKYGEARSQGIKEFETAIKDLAAPRRRLSCQLYQRSADAFLGVPFNIASYALLTHMIAHVTGMAVGDFVWTGGDVHLYLNHVEQARTQLERESRPLPSLELNPFEDDLFSLNADSIKLTGYNPHPAIKAEVSV